MSSPHYLPPKGSKSQGPMTGCLKRSSTDVTLAGRSRASPRTTVLNDGGRTGRRVPGGPRAPLTEWAQVLSLSGNLHVIDLDVAII